MFAACEHTHVRQYSKVDAGRLCEQQSSAVNRPHRACTTCQAREMPRACERGTGCCATQELLNPMVDAICAAPMAIAPCYTL
eukprot:364139-Chlamydomonas_euryale.AAC.4